MSVAANDRRSLLLMLSLLLLMLLMPFLENHRSGEVLILISLFVTLITTILDLHGRGTLRWLAIGAAIPVVLIELTGIFYPSHWLFIADYALLVAFFGFASLGLFTYLDKPGAITRGRIYGSVSLYLMLAMFWFALFNLTEVIHPGSFALDGALGRVPRSGFLYFSLITLTTVGYGDIVPVTPTGRVFAALEGAAGVLYIAITVARLVAAYQRTASER